MECEWFVEATVDRAATTETTMATLKDNREARGLSVAVTDGMVKRKTKPGGLSVVSHNGF